MEPFYNNIENETIYNEAYRKVLYTLQNFQLVVMSLKPGEDIGEELHIGTHQFIRVEQGSGYAIIGDYRYELYDNIVIIIPNNTHHNIINDGNIPLKLYTIYTGEILHPPNQIQINKPLFD
jgi:mannose-6-phosphate isomerase-like protein (cupin superfamily)